MNRKVVLVLMLIAVALVLAAMGCSKKAAPTEADRHGWARGTATDLPTTRRFVVVVTLPCERCEFPEPETLKAKIEAEGYNVTSVREWCAACPWPTAPPSSAE